MRIVILAAGVGSRLGRPIPKPLTQLSDGRSILQRQLESLAVHFPSSLVSIVVGFKKDLVMEAHPEVTFVYNVRFGETNTSKSLLAGLIAAGDDSVLWMNGDVVFDGTMLTLLKPAIAADRSFVAVNHASVGDEEVKYDLDDAGTIRSLSKTVTNALGEAVGVNFVAARDKGTLIEQLHACDDDDYFERGIEFAIERLGSVYLPVDVTDSVCIEVDFAEDLARANSAISRTGI